MNVAVDHQHIFQKRNRLRQLRAFCRVAEMGSITKASEALHLTQSVVSLDVRHLEREFETALFDRTKRKIGLSPAGERLYKLAEPLVRRMDALSAVSVEEIGDVVSRRIHFGATQAVAAFVLPKYLRRFQKRYPEMRMRVSVCRVRDGVKRIRDDDLEFLFGADATSLMNEDDMVYHHAAWYDHVLITAPDHPLAGRESVSLEEASTYPAVLPSPDMDPQRSEESDSRHFGVDWSVAIEVGRWSVLKLYVEHGLGISVVPSVCLGEDDALSAIPLTDHFPVRSYGVIARRGKFLTPATNCLIRLMAPDYPD